MRLLGKIILITAARQGIGRASAEACIRKGARVKATDRNMALLAGLNTDCHALDVMDTDAIAALTAKLPDLDGLFNCAGFVANGTILDLSEKEWDFSFDLNVKAMMRACLAFVPGMLRQAEKTGTASILNMASMASSSKGFGNRTTYGASKAAMIGLTKGSAAEKTRVPGEWWAEMAEVFYFDGLPAACSP